MGALLEKYDRRSQRRRHEDLSALNECVML